MNYRYGDNETKLVGQQFGINNLLYLDTTWTKLVGDTPLMTGISTGGDDWLSIRKTPGSTSDNTNTTFLMIGDADEMSGHSKGGDDNFVSDAGIHTAMYGDAIIMKANSIGGNDILGNVFSSGFKPGNTVYGDAESMQQSAAGGDDLLYGATGDATNYLYGDAYSASNQARGGNDILYSSGGTDHMWGDFAVIEGRSIDDSHFGNDIFYLLRESGHDYIYDFRPGEDEISLRSKRITDMSGFEITQDGENLVLTFDENNSVTLLGVTTVDASDFIFYIG